MLSIDVDNLGRLSLALPDAQGEFHPYTFELIAPVGLCLWSVRLVRCDQSKGDGDYVVRMVQPHKWDCECADHRFRGYRKRAESGCKHIQAARALAALLASLKSPFAPPQPHKLSHPA